MLNTKVGSLALEDPSGELSTIFPPGSTVNDVKWSPDGEYLLVERTNWLSPRDHRPRASGPPELWSVHLSGDAIESVTLLFRPPELDEAHDAGAVSEFVFGRWAPDGRHILVWYGPGASIRADGNQPWILNVSTGAALRLAEWSLVNPRYYSWAPAGARLAITVGGYRSAQDNKWLIVADLDTSTVTTVISKTEQIPGIVDWSPRGDLIAYAAVPTEKRPYEDNCCPMTFENPAIAGRRIYLLDPDSGEHWRLNGVDTYQDTPTWSTDGRTLYYVQKDGDDLVLMAADPETGMAEPIEASRRPAPERVGYYGQSSWDDMLRYAPNLLGRLVNDAR